MPVDEPDSGDGETATSPPCAAATVDQGYLGFTTGAALIDDLNELLRAERAGARGIHRLCLPHCSGALREILAAVGRDEGRFCVMLHRQVRRLGGIPDPTTGAFYDKLAACTTVAERLALLDRGQAWVARRLQTLLPRLSDAALIGDLDDMLRAHEVNLARCRALMP